MHKARYTLCLLAMLDVYVLNVGLQARVHIICCKMDYIIVLPTTRSLSHKNALGKMYMHF